MAKEKEVKPPLTILWEFRDIDAAQEFYQRKDELKLTTEKQCHLLLEKMAQEGKMKSIRTTKRTPEKVVEDYREKGFNILDKRGKKQLNIFKRVMRLWTRLKK